MITTPLNLFRLRRLVAVFLILVFLALEPSVMVRWVELLAPKADGALVICLVIPLILANAANLADANHSLNTKLWLLRR